MDLSICFPFFFIFQLLTYAVNRNLPGVSLRQRKCFLQFICLRWSVQLKRRMWPKRCCSQPCPSCLRRPECRRVGFAAPLAGMVPAIPHLALCSWENRSESSLGPTFGQTHSPRQREAHLFKKNKRFWYLPGREGPDRRAGKGIAGHCLPDTVGPTGAALLNS